MVRRSNECLEDPRCDGRLDVDNRDEHEHWISPSNAGTASEAVQPKPGRIGINVCH